MVKAVKLPVTVKTRLGWNDATKNIMEVAERLQDVGIQALSIHGRTRAQLYKGPADWTLIGEVKNNPRITIPIFGNGDIDSPEKAVEYRDRYGVDGIMIGRGEHRASVHLQRDQALHGNGHASAATFDHRTGWRLRGNTCAVRWLGKDRGKVWWKCVATTATT